MLDLNRITLAAGNSMEPTVPSPRLTNAAHQFEASMLQELLKPLQQQSGLSDSDKDSDDADSNSSLREYGTEVMAGALSQRGGLGISKMVLAKLAPIEAAQKQHKSANPSKS
jgi:Rod binding domain-containing protein